MSNMSLGMCTTMRPQCAGDPVRPLCWQLSKITYAQGMRQTLFSPRIRMTLASMRLGQSSFEIGYALGMRWPHSSLVIWIQLEHGGDPAGINLEQGYASGVCAGQATPLALPKCLSTKTDMR